MDRIFLGYRSKELRFLVLLLILPAVNQIAFSQAWSTFLDHSRAIDWSSAGFTIPNYTANCSVQPTLSANNSGAASANTQAIQSALASCDATHNVVNIPSGTYYVAGITFGTKGHQVLRGAGPNATALIVTADTSCGGFAGGICMINSTPTYAGSSTVLPPSGPQQCSWTGGYAQGSTSLTFSNCGGAPPLNATIILDQANDTSDTGGVYVCDVNIANCGYEGTTGGNNDGRSIGGKTHSQQQVTYTTGVTNNGNGTYTVTISPGVYFSNIRSSQAPGAWWPGTVANDGIENLTIDGAALPHSNITLYSCYQCWVKNVRSKDAARAHVILYQSMGDVVRDSYFYQSQSHASQSYVVESEESSAFLVENNIFQQVSNALMFGQGSGAVIGYNFGIDNVTTGNGYVTAAYAAHNAGNEMNLWEGNDFLGIWTDDSWGASDQQTYFRNLLSGWQNGGTVVTIPIISRSFVRALNLIGNVLGQPGYHTQYQEYATSTSAISGAALEDKSIYSIGLAAQGSCSVGAVTTCDPIAFNTLMRWGNWDVVKGATQWNSTEASPAAGAYLSANFSSNYFGSLAHTLPSSLYYQSTPTWWPAGKPWPPVGPDVSSGNLGVCSGGTYAGAQATAASQCSGGTFSSAWAAHANSIPAQDCYLNVMHGPADGTGSVLNFDANQCYSSSNTSGSGKSPAAPTGLVGTVN